MGLAVVTIRNRPTTRPIRDTVIFGRTGRTDEQKAPGRGGATEKTASPCAFATPRPGRHPITVDLPVHRTSQAPTPNRHQAIRTGRCEPGCDR